MLNEIIEILQVEESTSRLLQNLNFHQSCIVLEGCVCYFNIGRKDSNLCMKQWSHTAMILHPDCIIWLFVSLLDALAICLDPEEWAELDQLPTQPVTEPISKESVRTNCASKCEDSSVFLDIMDLKTWYLCMFMFCRLS